MAPREPRTTTCFGKTLIPKVKVLEERTVHHEIARLVLENLHHVGDDVRPNAGLSLEGGCPNVRGAVKPFHLQERMLRVNRFVFKDIKRRRSKGAGLQGFNHSSFIDDAAASTVDDVVSARRAVRTNLGHGFETLSVDKVMSFIG